MYAAVPPLHRIEVINPARRASEVHLHLHRRRAARARCSSSSAGASGARNRRSATRAWVRWTRSSWPRPRWIRGTARCAGSGSRTPPPPGHLRPAHGQRGGAAAGVHRPRRRRAGPPPASTPDRSPPVALEPPIAASGAARSRRPSRPGGRPPPAGRPARRVGRRGAGPGPAQASTSTSSPLRNRWQRTPPVARPLAGYSSKGVTLTRPGRRAGQGAGAAGHGDHDRLAAVPDCRRPGRPRRTRSPTRAGASLIPAMPPAARPCGRTAAAPKRSSCASLVTKTSSSVLVASSTAPTTWSPSLSAITSNSSRCRAVRGDPLHHALAVPQREPGGRAGPARAEREHASRRARRRRTRSSGRAARTGRGRARSAAARAGRARRAGSAARAR